MTTVEFGSKDAADAIREEYPDALCPDDDRRLKTVRFSSGAPDHVVEDAQRQADQSRADAERGPGQLELTDAERESLDFSRGRANIPHAQSVKAIARSEGVDDWTAFYDPTLTVDEHRDVMDRASRDESGRRHDEQPSATERAGRAAAQADAGECNHARDHCEHGDPDACAFLRDRCGFDDSEIDALLNRDGPDDQEEEITGQAAGALQRSWNGYKAAIADAETAVTDGLAPNWQQAQQAARAINSIRGEHGQDPIHFERLEEIQADVLDLAREMAADCHECHADHTNHAHAGPERERLDDAVGATDQDVREAVETATGADA